LLRLRLRQMDLEDAVAAFRRDLVDVDILRQREASRELAVERFAPMLPLVVGRLLDAPLAAQRQHAVLDADIDVFLLDLGQIGLDRVLVVGLDDIRRRTPLQAFAYDSRTQARKLAGVAIEEVFELPKRTPGDQVHVSPSYVDRVSVSSFLNVGAPYRHSSTRSSCSRRRAGHDVERTR